MIRIYSTYHDDQLVPLANPNEYSDHSNIFTVIIGKNGVGKSRLLSAIAKDASAFSNHGGTSLYEFSENHRSKVIAISTSPFDKFPSFRRRPDAPQTRYRYVGMRGEGVYSSSSAVSLISSAAKGLLEKLLANQNDADLISVFHALNLSRTVEFIFKPSFLDQKQSPYSTDNVVDDSLRIDLNALQRDFGIFIDERYHPILDRLSFSEKKRTIHYIQVLQQVFSYKKAMYLQVDFSLNAVKLDGSRTHPEHIEAILHLMNLGLIRLMDVLLFKIGYGLLSLKRASSGEQCLFLLILGIAGHIEDGSLILIDEPEISLHPLWQEEFMGLLQLSFRRYANCQFIVATHSPQITSRLQDKNSYITSLSTYKLYSATEFHHKSADFQLAELFGAPGRMNEYISRIAFNLLAKLRARKNIDSEIQVEASKLFSLQNDLEREDPVYSLIESIHELYQHYASHQ